MLIHIALPFIGRLPTRGSENCIVRIFIIVLLKIITTANIIDFYRNIAINYYKLTKYFDNQTLKFKILLEYAILNLIFNVQRIFFSNVLFCEPLVLYLKTKRLNLKYVEIWATNQH